MRLSPPTLLRAPAARQPPAGDFLGAHHPLVRAIHACAVVAHQALAVGITLAGAAVAGACGAEWARTVGLSALIVLLILAGAAAELHQRKRQRALDLILEGRERLPIAAIRRERRRLLDPRTRSLLAASFQTMAQEATSRPKMVIRASRPLFDVKVVAGVAEELRAVARLLGPESESARGVALAERLVMDGMASPLYGHNIAALREQLKRIRYLLSP